MMVAVLTARVVPLTGQILLGSTAAKTRAGTETGLTDYP